MLSLACSRTLRRSILHAQCVQVVAPALSRNLTVNQVCLKLQTLIYELLQLLCTLCARVRQFDDRRKYGTTGQIYTNDDVHPFGHLVGRWDFIPSATHSFPVRMAGVKGCEMTTGQTLFILWSCPWTCRYCPVVSSFALLSNLSFGPYANLRLA